MFPFLLTLQVQKMAYDAIKRCNQESTNTIPTTSYSNIPTVTVNTNIVSEQDMRLFKPGVLIKIKNTDTYYLSHAIWPLLFKGEIEK